MYGEMLYVASEHRETVEAYLYGGWHVVLTGPADRGPLEGRPGMYVARFTYGEGPDGFSAEQQAARFASGLIATYPVPLDLT